MESVQGGEDWSVHVSRHKEAEETGRVSVNLEQIMATMSKIKVVLKLHFLKITCAEHFGQTKCMAELGKH